MLVKKRVLIKAVMPIQMGLRTERLGRRSSVSRWFHSGLLRHRISRARGTATLLRPYWSAVFQFDSWGGTSALTGSLGARHAACSSPTKNTLHLAEQLLSRRRGDPEASTCCRALRYPHRHLHTEWWGSLGQRLSNCRGAWANPGCQTPVVRRVVGIGGTDKSDD
jgi:hypothetical protein